LTGNFRRGGEPPFRALIFAKKGNGNMPEELQCPSCSWHRVVDLAGKLQTLLAAGKLRRDKSPDPAIVEELFRQQLPQISCGACGGSGLRLRALREDSEDWGDAKVCRTCKQTISPERLEIFPNAEQCARCQQKADSGEGENDVDFCPRCGEVMIAGTSRSAGLTRYRLRCPTCG